MSDIRKKTAAVVAAGKSQRETWTPTLGSTPLRHYMWWREQTGKHRQVENFCHFWRVVLIWAPLLRVRRALSSTSAAGSLKTGAKRINKDALVVVAMAIVVIGYLVYGSVQIAAELWGRLGWWSVIVAPVCLIGICVGTVAAIMGVFYVLGAIGGFVSRKLRPVIARRRKVTPVTTEEYQDYLAAQFECEVPGRPSRGGTVRLAFDRLRRGAKRFLGSCWEYTVLVAQIIRTKKWKICPIVEIPDVQQIH